MLVCTYSAYSQNAEMWLLNGKKVTIADYKIDNSEIEGGIVYFTNDKGKEKKEYVEDIFSITDGKGLEKIYYDGSSDILTPEEMKIYLQGLSDVLENYKAPSWLLIGGLASGVIGGMMPQPNFESGGFNGSLPVGILIPLAYVSAIGVTSPDIEQIAGSFPNTSDQEYYLNGVQDGIQKKRLQKGLIGGGIGFAAGIITLLLIN